MSKTPSKRDARGRPLLPLVTLFVCLIPTLWAAGAAPRPDTARVVRLYNEFVTSYNESNRLLTRYEQGMNRQASGRVLDAGLEPTLREVIERRRKETAALEAVYREQFGRPAGGKER